MVMGASSYQWSLPRFSGFSFSTAPVENFVYIQTGTVTGTWQIVAKPVNYCGTAGHRFLDVVIGSGGGGIPLRSDGDRLLDAYWLGSDAGLSWKIDDNATGYLIERSYNGIDFEIISDTWNVGSDNMVFAIDKNESLSKEPERYYKIRYLYKNGEAYSTAALLEKGKFNNTLFPNPVSSQLNILDQHDPALLGLIIYNSQGIKLTTLERQTDYKIDVRNFPNGTYQVQFNYSNKPKAVVRFIVNH
jgi:hypothetical protein